MSRARLSTVALIIFGCPISVTAVTTPAAAATLSEIPIPANIVSLQGMILGGDGNLWAGSAGPRIVKITTTGAMTAYPLPFPKPGDYEGTYYSLAKGPSGEVWWATFARFEDNVGKVSTADGKATLLVTFKRDGSGPHKPARKLQLGPDGNMWFSYDRNPNGFLGYITPAGSVTYVDYAPKNANGTKVATAPFDLKWASDGSLWFADFVGSIGHFDPRTNAAILYPMKSPQAGPKDLAIGPDGNIWTSYAFGNGTGAAVARVTPAGAVTEFPVPYTVKPGASLPISMIASPDGAMWYADESAKLIVRVAMDGTITTMPTPYEPETLVVGSDGGIWIQYRSNKSLGKITF